ncbi:MAG: hypothetical protein JOZ17_18320 [Acetobacteraceae bacterium]|nr:hypothetical protein [Acetobacteraceae bacterium]
MKPRRRGHLNVTTAGNCRQSDQHNDPDSGLAQPEAMVEIEMIAAVE